jgi:hypothetical protein
VPVAAGTRAREKREHVRRHLALHDGKNNCLKV